MKLVKEALHENWGAEEAEEAEGELDIGDVVGKMDKFMPEDAEMQQEYYDIIDGDISIEDKINELTDFIEMTANDRLNSYLGNREISELATYIIHNES